MISGIMEPEPSSLFAALGHPSRLGIFRLLARRAPGGVPAGEIASVLGMAANTASVHLATLARAGLIHGRREGKQVLYALDMARTGGLIDYLALDCCRGRPELCAPLARAVLAHPVRAETPTMDTDRSYTVLFICTGNSARSIFAEAIMNQSGQGRFKAFSAGVRPQTELNPFAIDTLRRYGYDVAGLSSKHLSVFQNPDAPRFDFVFTVCDDAANEECPPWPGQPISGHWAIPDPVKATGTEAEKALAFQRAFGMLKRRIDAFCALRPDSLDRIALQRAVDRIEQTATIQEKA
jgi:arsenate reductase